MTLKLSNEFDAKREAFINAVQNNETEEKQAELYGEMLNSILDEAKKEAANEVQSMVAKSPADEKLAAGERKFFNEINTEVGYKEETLLPQTTIDRIFEDLVTEHPLLAKIGLRNAGLRLKFLKSETSGVAVWGKVFGEIKGQLDAAFSDEEVIQNKLTAFVVIPKDLEQFGPAWIESFVRTQINEAFSVALELAFLNGTGNDQPVGLVSDLTKGTVANGVTTYAKKVAQGTLTFTDSKTVVKELTNVYKFHSTKENSQQLAVDGKVVMVVNPTDAWDVKKQYTSLNANGIYVTAMPYNLQLVESVAQTVGEVTTFIEERYDAYIGGGVTVRKYDQTLALEDMDLYTAKQFVYGKAKDNKAAAVWTLAITETPEG